MMVSVVLLVPVNDCHRPISMHMVYEVLDFDLHDIPSTLALTFAWLRIRGSSDGSIVKEMDERRDQGIWLQKARSKDNEE